MIERDSYSACVAAYGDALRVAGKHRQHNANALHDIAATEMTSFDFPEPTQRTDTPLRDALELLATGTPDLWREQLDDCYRHHDDDNLAIYLAREASKHTLDTYDEPNARWHFDTLRTIGFHAASAAQARQMASDGLAGMGRGVDFSKVPEKMATDEYNAPRFIEGWMD
jgi:hypothetical protein